MRKWSDKPEVQERFNPLNEKIDLMLKKMPELNEIHDPNKPGSTDVVPYDIKAYAFLEEYKKDLDTDRVLKTLGIPRKVYESWLLEPKFTDVINRIHKAYEDAVLMDAKTVAGWSIEILRDIHNEFKEGNFKVANALSSMAGNMLRASGNFKDTQANTPQVLIQINTGAENKPVKDITQDNSPAQSSEVSINISTENKNDKERISRLPILRGA